jgi:hypothetical protein
MQSQCVEVTHFGRSCCEDLVPWFRTAIPDHRYISAGCVQADDPRLGREQLAPLITRAVVIRLRPAVRASDCDNPGSSLPIHNTTVSAPCPDLIRASTPWLPRSPKPRKTWMPTDEVRGLKAHGSSPATGIFGCLRIVADNRFPSTGQPWAATGCPPWIFSPRPIGVYVAPSVPVPSRGSRRREPGPQARLRCSRHPPIARHPKY